MHRYTKTFAAIAAALCIGTAAQAQQTITTTTITTGNPDYCREYTQTFTIAGETQTGYGTACLQPDGAWAIRTPPSGGTVIVNGVAQPSFQYVVRDNQVLFIPVRPFAHIVVPRAVAIHEREQREREHFDDRYIQDRHDHPSPGYYDR